MKSKLTYGIVLMMLIMLTSSLTYALPEGQSCLYQSPSAAGYSVCTEEDTLCEANTIIDSSCDNQVFCTRTLSSYCSLSLLRNCLFTDRIHNYTTLFGNEYIGFDDTSKSELISGDSTTSVSACEVGCCSVTTDSGVIFAFGGDQVPRVQCEDYNDQGKTMLTGEVRFTPGACTQEIASCVGEGAVAKSIIDLSARPSQQCCSGLQEFNYTGDANDGVLCYNGTSLVCEKSATPLEGYYYDLGNGVFDLDNLLLAYNCDLSGTEEPDVIVLPTYCFDSDGIDYFTEGNATDNDGNNYSDVCTDSVLTEYYCFDGLLNSVDYNCPNDCDGNKCAQVVNECFDSDEGVKPYTTGWTLFYDSTSSQPPLRGNDTCINETHLIEYSCSENGELLPSEPIECRSGCENGRCIGDNCADDGEKVYFDPFYGPVECCDENSWLKPALTYLEVYDGVYSAGCIGDKDFVKGICSSTWATHCGLLFGTQFGGGTCEPQKGEDFCNCPDDCLRDIDNGGMCLDEYFYVEEAQFEDEGFFGKLTSLEQEVTNCADGSSYNGNGGCE
ncbi:hypothetical protein KY334_06495 [Candidatus Woesearchaeota archaeon]|nr:hypothetical protein [Candidatus Woesearchaeota archaeon]